MDLGENQPGLAQKITGLKILGFTLIYQQISTLIIKIIKCQQVTWAISYWRREKMCLYERQLQFKFILSISNEGAIDIFLILDIL